ncbi:MAG: hypothetical protein K2X98_03015 [Alphaproteobacteria bacterium]|nr:hypothetical protein [Alphaproteobacteria bacterium]
MVSPIMQNYANAARLGGKAASPQTQSDGDVFDAFKKTETPFKSELSSVVGSVTGGLKQTGAAAEHNITAQIMGVGNTEKTAIALNELGTHMEIVSQALRIMIEKINELTTRTMGG